MKAAVMPAAAAGYSAIALDNYGLVNSWKACGSYSGPNGTWKQLYGSGGVDPAQDPKYEADIIEWTERAVERIHNDTGLLVIPNFSEHSLANDGVLKVANLTDGFLAEGLLIPHIF